MNRLPIEVSVAKTLQTNYIVPYYTILYYIILYYTILYYIILYYTILTILYYIIGSLWQSEAHGLAGHA